MESIIKNAVFAKTSPGRSIFELREKKITEKGVEIYRNNEFVAGLSVDELEEIYKNVKHAQIEELKGLTTPALTDGVSEL